VTIILALILMPFTVLTLCFAVELFVGLRPLAHPDSVVQRRSDWVIVVPAHDEDAIISDSLGRLKEACGDRARILVVADNCTDLTGPLARQALVNVIERVDPGRRGKGFALDFAKKHLRTNPPDIVLIMDADCTTDRASIEHLISHCAATQMPCQAIYLQRPALEGPPMLQLSMFAFFVKNVIRQRAQQRLAGRAHLLGTGMALPWPLFDRANLASPNIVEDLALGLDLASSGHPATLVEDAFVWSDSASRADTFEQRRRWEGGYLESALRRGPRALGRSIGRMSTRDLWAAISLMIPPIALLVLTDTLILAAAALAAYVSHTEKWPLLPLTGGLVLAALGLSLAWRAGGSRFVTLGALARVPLYVAWKLPLYVGLAKSGVPKEWVRTGRGKPS
jgi:hypothetical protein